MVAEKHTSIVGLVGRTFSFLVPNDNLLNRVIEPLSLTFVTKVQSNHTSLRGEHMMVKLLVQKNNNMVMDPTQQIVDFVKASSQKLGLCLPREILPNTIIIWISLFLKLGVKPYASDRAAHAVEIEAQFTVKKKPPINDMYYKGYRSNKTRQWWN